MCTELREQPALSVARVEVNYFQRRLPGASIKAAFCFSLSFSLSISISLSHPLPPFSSVSLPPPLSHVKHTHVPTKAHMHLLPHTATRRSRSPRCFCIPASSLVAVTIRRHTAPRLSTRTLHECTRLPWLRRESARIARFLREPGNSRVSDETMCHGSLISHRKVRLAARKRYVAPHRAELSRVKLCPSV